MRADLTPGEFVIKKSSAQKIGYGNLHNMNEGRQKFASGGMAIENVKYPVGSTKKYGLYSLDTKTVGSSTRTVIVPSTEIKSTDRAHSILGNTLLPISQEKQVKLFAEANYNKAETAGTTGSLKIANIYKSRTGFNKAGNAEQRKIALKNAYVTQEIDRGHKSLTPASVGPESAVSVNVAGYPMKPNLLDKNKLKTDIISAVSSSAIKRLLPAVSHIGVTANDIGQGATSSFDRAIGMKGLGAIFEGVITAVRGKAYGHAGSYFDLPAPQSPAVG